jgi:RNA polymerase sigma-70 factor, ECF subfamily
VNNQKYIDDTYLIEACIKRDLAAWSTFIDKYSRLIARSIDCRLRKHGFRIPEQDIQDIRQNVFASIWQDRKLETITNTTGITYWLAIVSGNIAMEHMRHNRLFKTTPLSIDPESEESALNGLIPAAESPALELDRQALRQKVDTAIDELPPEERLVIRMSILHGKTYEEIAKVMRLPANTVASHAKRAKERLREALKDYL